MRTRAPSLQFLGGAETVTGSKYLVRTEEHAILLDCGLFQGLKFLRERNWARPAFRAREITAVVLSHAHLDHSGYLPILVRNGFRGAIHCTDATADLLRVLLIDAAHLQEMEAEFANRRGFSKHRPAKPLFTKEDAEAALRLCVPHAYGESFRPVPEASAVFHRAGHILGSSIVELVLERPHPHRIVFSGDLGRWGRPILRDPELIRHADTLLVESTYGDRLHAPDAEERLAEVVRDVETSGGVLVVPAFALGRTQELIWHLRQLEDDGRIPVLPVFIDSPMAIDVTAIYGRHRDDHDLDMQRLADRERSPLRTRKLRMLHTADESKSLNGMPGPMIIISASGMATGGRVLHHLARLLPDPRNVVLLAGFQAAGTRGRTLADGATEVRMHGVYVPVRAKVVCLDGLSAHADRNDILRWLKGFEQPPRQTFVVHGEPQPADRLSAMLRNDLQWNARVALDREVVSLSV